MNPFQVLAHKYDIFNAADIPAYVEFIRKAFETGRYRRQGSA